MDEKKKSGTLDRRQFLQAMGGTIGGAAIGAVGGGLGVAEAKIWDWNAFSHRRKPLKSPNFLILMCDENRFPPVYEDEQIKQWRKTNLVTQDLLRANGMEFMNHYTGATACAPARGTVFTGQYPSLHGVTQTTGVAKGPYDPDTFWLDPSNVPTMGDYFRAAGYRTYYKGKWHASEADLPISGTHDPVLSYDKNTGVSVPEKEQLYLHADRLDGFGFTGWIGPEPHGKSPRDSGSSAATGVSGRDIGFADQVVELLDDLQYDWRTDPWLIVASFVNPHDIALYGFVSAHDVQDFKFTVDSTVPNIPPSPTDDEDLLANNKPRCQESYHNTYQEALQPTFDTAFYRQLYYQLQKNVDQQMLRVFTKLRNSRFYDNTIVIFLSDHGELLGSHGGLHQKWYCAYEEAIHVPIIIHNRRLFSGYQSVEMLTSHIDLLPTMLGLAGADINRIRNILSRDHAEAQPLVGRDLSPLILGQGDPERAEEPLYFMTDDDVTRGLDQVNWLGWKYNSVIQPNHVETVIATFEGSGGGKEIWKYSRYFDNPQFWTDPGVKDDVMVEIGPPNTVWGGIKAAVCDTIEKTTADADELEMYNVTVDPYEQNNLAGNPTYAARQQELAAILDQQRCQKRLSPSVACVPGMPPPCGVPCQDS
jgi:arylsulfatase A-like enzyme